MKRVGDITRTYSQNAPYRQVLTTQLKCSSVHQRTQWLWVCVGLVVFVVHIILVKANVMQKLDGMKRIIQLKVQNHQNTFQSNINHYFT